MGIIALTRLRRSVLARCGSNLLRRSRSSAHIALESLGGSRLIRGFALSPGFFVNPLENIRSLLKFALPQSQHLISKLPESCRRSLVAALIGGDLSSPKIRPCLRYGGPLAVFVPVPEAPMNEDDHFEAGEHNVWLPRQISAVQPKTISGMMKEPPDCHLRSSVLAGNAPHISAALTRREVVSTVRDHSASVNDLPPQRQAGKKLARTAPRFTQLCS